MDFWIYRTIIFLLLSFKKISLSFPHFLKKMLSHPRGKTHWVDHFIRIWGGSALSFLRRKKHVSGCVSSNVLSLSLWPCLKSRRNNLFDVEWANAREFYSCDLHWQTTGQSAILEQTESQLKSLCYKIHQACQFNFKAVQNSKRELYIRTISKTHHIGCLRPTTLWGSHCGNWAATQGSWLLPDRPRENTKLNPNLSMLTKSHHMACFISTAQLPCLLCFSGDSNSSFRSGIHS